MKKISVIFFIFVFLLITGRYLLFISYIELNKNYLKTSAIAKKELKCIQIQFQELYKNTSVISWEDKNTEIKINSKMYDILEIRKMSTGYSIIAVEDFKETNWLNCFAKLNEENNDFAKNLLSLLFQIGFYENASIQILDFIKSESKKTTYTYLTQILSDYFFKIIKPPIH